MKKSLVLIAVIITSSLPVIFAAEVLQEITLKEGDTLWGIASYYLKDPNRWPEILKHNQLPLTDPTAALPGMKLKIPVLLIKEHLRKASLVMLLNDVRYRRKDQTAWKKAAKETELFNEDGLRTMENSRADVKFYSGDILRLDENSLVILRPELKVEEASLMSGAIRSSRTRVITPTAQVTPQSKDTVYKARIRSDKATIVHVEKGSAEVMGLDTGKKILVEAGFANITLPKTAPTIPVKVPQMPDFKVPDFNLSGNVIIADLKELKNTPVLNKNLSAPKPDLEIDDELPGKATVNIEDFKSKIKSFKSWREYKIIVAKDPKFTQIVWENRRPIDSDRVVTYAKDYNLPDGSYYRGVSYFDNAGNESNVFLLGPFELDSRPPRIVLSFPPDGYTSKEVLVNVEGQTEPKAHVTINNYPVSVSSEGRFTWSVVLANEGANKIKINVRDRSGNKSEIERVIYLGGRK